MSLFEKKNKGIREVYNTKDEIQTFPELMLLEMSSSRGVGGAIEAQEAQGQRSFVNSTQIPIDGNYTKDYQKQLKALGFVLGEPTDDLFMQAELPEGWKKEASDHSMWSYIVDDKGRRRASIFYKAAFYDRSAHMGLERAIHFNINRDKDGEGNSVHHRRQAVVIKCGETVWQSEWFESDPIKDKWGDKPEKDARAEGLKWLKKNYPKWEDSYTEYWD